MSPRSYFLRDTATMLRRDGLHSVRNIAITVSGLGLPIIMLLLFVYFFGGAIGASLGGLTYLDYVMPGILIMTVGSGCATTALNLCMDMSEGIVARFRTMPISRAAVLTGQVVGSLLRTMISIVLVVAVAFLLGFRTSAGIGAWLAAFGLVALLTFAITWMGVAFGLVGKTPAGANSMALMFQLLAFTSSAFVKPSSMSGAVRAFAEYQPFTPVIDTLRGLLLGTPIGNRAILAVGWCVALTLLGYFWSRAVYDRNSVANNFNTLR